MNRRSMATSVHFGALGISAALIAGLAAPRSTSAAPDLWIGGDGEWSDATHWSFEVPQGTDDAVNLLGSAIDFNYNGAFNTFITDGDFSVSGGQLTGNQANAASTIEVDGSFTFNGGGVYNVTISQGLGGPVVADNNGNNFIDSSILNSDFDFGAGFMRFYGVNTASSTLSIGGGVIQLRDSNTTLSLSSASTLHGQGSVNQDFGGATVANSGTVSADVPGQTLGINCSNATGDGVFQGVGGGILSFSGQLTGTGVTVVHADTGTVIINGGGVAGTIAAATGSGISFAGNGNNYLSSANIQGNLSLAGNGYVQAYGTNEVGGTIFMSTSNGIQLRDSNALLKLDSGGQVLGYGSIYESFGGSTFENEGTVSANVSGQTLYINNSNLTGAGVLDARNGGIISIGALLTGNGMQVNVDNTPGSVVEINGGGLTGTLGSTTGSGLSFSSNGNNNIQSATVNGLLSFPGGGYAQAYGVSTINGAIAMSTSNGIQLRDGNATLDIAAGATLHGYGQVYQSFSNASVANNGSISADVGGQVLYLNTSYLNGSGVLDARNGGQISIDAFLTGTGMQVNVDNTPGSLVEINGGGLGGSIGITTGSGLSFSSNGANSINGATVQGNLTFPGGAYAQVYNTNEIGAGGNILMSTSNGIQLRDNNATLTLDAGAQLGGYGSIYQSFNGSTLVNNGTISANVPAQTLYINNSNLLGSGVLDARNGGQISIGAFLTGTGMQVNVDNTPGSLVEINGGGLGGSIGITTGSGLSFSSNGANSINGATVQGNLTFPGGAYAQVYNINEISAGGNILMSTSNGIQLRDNNATLTLDAGAQLGGYGSIYQSFNGSTLVDNGTISANVPAQTLYINNSNLLGSGVLDARNGGQISIGAFLNGTGMQVNVDNTPGSLVEINGGGLGGSIGITTGSGLSFSSNGNNFTSSATVSGLLSFPQGAYAQMYGVNTINGSIAIASTANGIQLRDNNATLSIASGGMLHGFGNIYQSFGGANVANGGTIAADVPGQTLAFSNDNDFNTGHILVVAGATMSFGGQLTQSAGQSTIDGAIQLNNTFAEIGGEVAGIGAIQGSLNNTGGIVLPGDSPGLLTVTGFYSQGSAAELEIELGGYSAGTQFDQLDVGGVANLDGTLDVDLINGFLPNIGDTFDIILRQGGAGFFASTISDDAGLTYSVDYENGFVAITLLSVPEPTTALVLAGGCALGLLRRRRAARE